MPARRVYLAGPEVFLPDARAVLEAKRALCERHGLEGVAPIDAPERAHSARAAIARSLHASNEALLRSCELLIANLTPFRGPSADVGTVYELGLARGLGLPVFGYTNASGTLLERTLVLIGATEPAPFDPDGLAIEDFDLADNLMIDGAIRASGGVVIVSPSAPARRFTDLRGFEACVEQAVARLGPPDPSP